MKEREDDFLREAFANYNSEYSLNADFNKKVIQKIDVQLQNSTLIRRFLSIYLPILILFMVGSTVLLFLYSSTFFTFLLNLIPMLRPWQILLVIGIIYFHFVRSILFLTFIYLKKQFNFVFRMPLNLR